MAQGRVKVDFKGPEFIGEGKIYRFASESREGHYHYVVVGKHGVRCTCEGFQYQQRCWHTDKIPYEPPKQ